MKLIVTRYYAAQRTATKSKANCQAPASVYLVCRGCVRLDQEGQLGTFLGRRAQRRPLQCSGDVDNVLRRNGELELKSANEDKEESLESKDSNQLQCYLVLLLWLERDVLDQGKPISDACAVATNKGKEVAPHAGKGRCSRKRLCPPFGSGFDVYHQYITGERKART